MRPSQVAVVALAMPALFRPASPAIAQARYQLRSKAAVGDKCMAVADADLHCALVVSAKGDTSPELTVGQTESRKCTQVVMAVSAAGRVTKLRRFHEKAEQTQYLPTQGAVTKTLTYQGRVVVAQQQGGKVTVTSNPAGLAAAEREAAKGWLDDNPADLLPSRDVAVGDEWTVDPKSLAHAMPGARATSAHLRARLAEIADYAGRQSARIEITADIKAKLNGLEAYLAVKLAGSVYFALDLQRIVAVEVSGPLTIEGSVRVQGTKVAVTGSGELSSKEAITWLQADGKAVEEPK